MDVLGKQGMHMPLVAWDVLALQFVGGAAQPRRPVLDVPEFRNCLGGLHSGSYIFIQKSALSAYSALQY